MKIESADQWQANKAASLFGIELIGGPAELHFEVAGTKIRSCAHSETNHRKIFAVTRCKLLAVRIIDIDHRCMAAFTALTQVFEKPSFGLKVILHPAVEIEVVLRQVRKNGGIESN